VGLLIDSSVFITLERGQRSLNALASIAPDDSIALASITASELLIGVHRADTADRRVRREAYVEAILTRVPILPFDLHVARVHAQISAELMSIGHPIGAHDLLIAATAVAHGYRVLTDNLRHFERVPGLTVLQPEW
jgi:predicted nucleic acid-binding protein